MGERRSGTRERIQAVAVELFAEHGYEKTSLREIAERLDVTKAALYYHFNTKEAIVVSLFEDLIAGIDGIINWGMDQPPTLETRQELIRRYGRLARERPKSMMRFIQESKTTMQELAPGEKLQCRFRTLSGMLHAPDAPLDEQLKSALALITASASVFMLKDAEATDDERYEAGLKLALELVSGEPAAQDTTR
ncbi:MAG TPA: TetR/AcrR family transcriptional regulator [Actinoallomurus sp.]|jgi:AcrR family transcriptional regulator|nr:TetR/AcrR family transcriptional regulator [Actinoallomurus sp.]